MLSIGSSFFWLCSILLSSTTWLIFLQLRSEYLFILFYSVLIQETMRILFYSLFIRAQSRGFTLGVSSMLFKSNFKSSNHLESSTSSNFDTSSSTSTTLSTSNLEKQRKEKRERVIDYFSSSLAIGLGFGVTHAMIMYGSILAHASGKGNMYSAACEGMSIFVLSAIMSCGFVLLHILLSLCAFDALSSKKWTDLIFKFAIVVSCHLIASLLTLLNEKGGNCIASLVLVYAVIFGLGVYTMRIVYTSVVWFEKLDSALN